MLVYAECIEHFLDICVKFAMIIIMYYLLLQPGTFSPNHYTGLLLELSDTSLPLLRAHPFFLL